MKITRFITMFLLICVMFQFSVNAENSKNTDPLDKALADAMVALVKKDYKKAVKLLEPLAKEGNVRAETLLAPLIFKGAGVEKDVNRGLAMIMNAASQGDEDAKKIAVDLNHELASLGDEKAMYNMGYMCLNGWGGEIGSDQCLTLLEKAAKAGHSRSAKFLAYIYKNGKYGITADQNKAEYWSQYSPQQAQQSKK